MHIENWEQVSQLFDRAMSLEGTERADFIRRSATSGEIAGQVMRLVKAAERQTGFMATHSPDFDDVRQLSVGTKLGNWEIESLLGAGGMGEVYLARRADGLFEQTAALKLIASTEPVAWQRFSRERQVLANLEHPSIGRLIDGGVAPDNRPFLVMEYIPGTPLNVYAEQRQLTRSERIGLFLDVCAAVAHAHSRLVLHRDIKPTNILVTHEGQVRLVDFGVAALLNDGAEDDAGAPMTLAYAAPEQITGAKVSSATDVFGLGATLHDVLTGEPPARRGREAQIETAHLSPVLRDVLSRAMAERPEDRYPTVDALAADLRRVLDDLPLAHQQDSTRAVVSSFVRRNPFFVGPAVLGVAAIIGWAVTAQILSVGYERERDRARAEEQRAIRTRDAVIDIFRRSSPQQTDTLFTPSANQSAWSYLAQAAEATMEDLSEEPETVLELLYWTIAIYDAEKDLERLKAAVDRYVSLSRSTFGAGHIETLKAEALAFRHDALLSNKSAQAERAVDTQSRSDIIFDGLMNYRDAHPNVVAESLLQLGAGYQALGEREKEAQMYHAVLALDLPADRRQTDFYTLRAEMALSYTLKQDGEFDEALTRALRALELTEKHVPANHIRLLAPLIRIAGLLDEAGRAGEALPYAERALRVQQAAVGGSDYELDDLRNTLANINATLGNYDEAERYFLANLALYEDQGMTDTLNYSITFQNIGIMLEKAGRYDDAADYYQKALQTRQSLTSERDVARYIPMISLSRTQLRAGKFESAAQTARSGRRHLAPLLPSGHLILALFDCFEGEAVAEQEPARAGRLLQQGLAILSGVSGREAEARACQAALARLPKP